MSAETAPAPSANRIQSLDQYRGYAIFGMLLVNFFHFYGTKWVNPDSRFSDGLKFIFGEQLHHHGHFMTYADTIAPIFMFVVGIGMRLSWTRRMQHVEPGVARKAMAKRYFLIVLIAFTIYTGWLWDALMNIGLSGLIAVLIVDKKWPVRIAYALSIVIAYQLIFSTTSYGEWLLRMGQYGKNLDWPFITTFLPLRSELLDVRINGGLIGHWGWSFMLIIGTIAYDIMQTQDRKKIITGLLTAGIILTIAGWSVKCIGTQAYYKNAEPFVAAAILNDFYLDLNAEEKQVIEDRVTKTEKIAPELSEEAQKEAHEKAVREATIAIISANVNQLVHLSPGILSSKLRGNDEAQAALEARSWGTLKVVGADTLTTLAQQVPPATPRIGNEWVFSKNYVTIPYVFWATALCLFHLLGFYIVVDVMGINIPGMKVIGLNPLFIYIFQSLALESFGNFMQYSTTEAARGWIPGAIMDTFEAGRPMHDTSSPFIVFGSFLLFYGFIYCVAYYFYKKNIIIKI